jgi:hypothetical protein
MPFTRCAGHPIQFADFIIPVWTVPTHILFLIAVI